MKEVEIRKVLNTGDRKYSEKELDIIVMMLKRLAEIEYSNNKFKITSKTIEHE